MAIKTKSEIEISGDVFIRTVTFSYTGTVTAVSDDWIALADAAVIYDTGRFADAMKSGELSEVEPYPNGQTVLIARGGIIDVTEWPHDLPRTQK